MSRKSFKLIPIAVVILLIAVLSVAVYFLQQNPEGPVPIEWDRSNCAECKMAISDRKFAAQFQTEGGEVFNFDDPGCLFIFLSKRGGLRVRAIYFWSYQKGGGWIERENVLFVRVPHSPMGFNLGAVDRRFAPERAFSFREAYALVMKHLGEIKGNKVQSTKR